MVYYKEINNRKKKVILIDIMKANDSVDLDKQKDIFNPGSDFNISHKKVQKLIFEPKKPNVDQSCISR
jgi:hypothetical protein